MPRESVPLLRASAAAAAAAAAASRLAQRSVLAVASRPERWLVSAPQGRSAEQGLVFFRKSVVLTSTMSSKHSYARSGERGEK